MKKCIVKVCVMLLLVSICGVSYGADEIWWQSYNATQSGTVLLAHLDETTPEGAGWAPIAGDHPGGSYGGFLGEVGQEGDLTAPGKFNTGYRPDGLDDHADFFNKDTGAATNILGDLTLEAWVKFDVGG